MGEEMTTIAVIGGRGAMGSLFVRVLREAGHEVLVSDVGTSLRAEDAAAGAEVTLVCVPIDATVGVIESVGPQVPDDGVIIDICSLKAAPVAAMLRSSRAEVIGMHPMFGPGVASLRGQVFVLCPARGARWDGWLRSLLDAQGATIVDAAPEEHDRIMSVIQVLRHFATIAFGRTLSQLGVDLDRSLAFSSPIYRLELIMIGRLFGQDPALYADIEMQNPLRSEVLDAYGGVVDEIAGLVKSGGRDGFIAMFHEVSAYFGPFREQAMSESRAIINDMVARGSSEARGD